MRRVIKPLEALLTSHKRIVLKDSAVSFSRLFVWCSVISIHLSVMKINLRDIKTSVSFDRQCIILFIVL